MLAIPHPILTVMVAMMTWSLFFGTGCARDEKIPSATLYETQGQVLRVVTTVSPITSLAENIGGTRIRLRGIVPEGANSHTYEPAPSVARVISEADLIILNGLSLEMPSLRMAEAIKKDAAVILKLGDQAIAEDQWIFDFSFPESGGHPNPHLWTDPLLGLKYAELIKDALARLDPPNLAYYQANYDKLKDRIEELDMRIAAAVATIPPENRRLLTYHDSFPYFAKRYGFQVIGAVQPSNFSEPSAREIGGLIDQAKETGVPAIFGSEVFPSKVMRQIAREAGTQFVDQLRDDDLPGKPGDPEHTYLGLILADMRVMIPPLGGDIDELSGFDTSLVVGTATNAEYPQ